MCSVIGTISESFVCVGQVCRVSVMFVVLNKGSSLRRAVYGVRNYLSLRPDCVLLGRR